MDKEPRLRKRDMVWQLTKEAFGAIGKRMEGWVARKVRRILLTEDYPPALTPYDIEQREVEQQGVQHRRLAQEEIQRIKQP